MSNMIFMAVSEFCASTANVWQVVGYALTVFKIVIPVLLIIFGMIDLGKAVMSSKDDEIKKSVGQLARRAIAGIVIFFIPTIVSVVIGLVQKEDESGLGTWDGCRQCISNPANDECKSAADAAWNN